MKTAVVKTTDEKLRQTIRKAGLATLLEGMKTRALRTGELAVQHPRLANMSDDEIVSICTIACVPLSYIAEGATIR